MRRQSDPSRTVRSRLSSIDQGLLIFGVTVALIVFGALTVDGFLNLENFQTVARLSAPLGILAVASALVIMGKNVDLSVAAVVGIAGMATVHFWTRSGYGEATAIVLILLVALAVGLVNGWLVAYVEIPALFVTLGTWKLFEGLFDVALLQGQSYELPRESGIVRSLGQGTLLHIDTPIWIAGAVYVAAWLFIKTTSYGKLLRATGDSPAAARLTGVPVRPLIVMVFIIAAILAALAGFLQLGLSGGYSRAYGSGEDLMFNAITAAVIGGVSLTGGKGSIFGVFAGTAFISIFVNIMTLMNVDVVASVAIRGAILVAALAFESWLHPRDEETAKSDDL